jgi:mono/diheme cytochrome c family protein
MRRHAAVALLGALMLAACAGGAASLPGASADGGDVEAGKQLATLYCTSCHAVGPDEPSRNPDAPPLRTLAERYPGALLVDAFPQRMRVGHPAMPDFALDDDQIAALLAYLLSIQERKEA